MRSIGVIVISAVAIALSISMLIGNLRQYTTQNVSHFGLDQAIVNMTFIAAGTAGADSMQDPLTTAMKLTHTKEYHFGLMIEQVYMFK